MHLPLFTIIANVVTVLEIIFAILVLSVVMPRIRKQAQVRDGLHLLRQLLLRSIGSVYVLLYVSVIILLIGFVIPREWRIYTIGTLLMIFGALADIYALSKYKIYTLSFSKKAIKFNDRKNRLEVAEQVREKRRDDKLKKKGGVVKK